MNRLFWEYSIAGIFLSIAVPFAGLALIPFYLVHSNVQRERELRIAKLEQQIVMDLLNNRSAK